MYDVGLVLSYPATNGLLAAVCLSVTTLIPSRIADSTKYHVRTRDQFELNRSK